MGTAAPLYPAGDGPPASPTGRSTREWDAVVTAECGSAGDTCVFVVVPDRPPIHVGGDAAPLACLAAALEEAAGGRFDAYVLRATRLDGRLWEIGLDPL